VPNQLTVAGNGSMTLNNSTVHVDGAAAPTDYSLIIRRRQTIKVAS
jgi:hypothetical protein